jgi:hypothetical protein
MCSVRVFRHPGIRVRFEVVSDGIRTIVRRARPYHICNCLRL